MHTANPSLSLHMATHANRRSTLTMFSTAIRSILAPDHRLQGPESCSSSPGPEACRGVRFGARTVDLVRAARGPQGDGRAQLELPKKPRPEKITRHSFRDSGPFNRKSA
jgi:hypothetical protein